MARQVTIWGLWNRDAEAWTMEYGDGVESPLVYASKGAAQESELTESEIPRPFCKGTLCPTPKKAAGRSR